MASFTSRVPLADGTDMPGFGLGLYDADHDAARCTAAVVFALRNGYRMLDTASYYGNEEAVGRGLRESGVPREEVYVVTKLHWGEHGRKAARRACRESLRRLQLPYVDLYLIHSPNGGRLLETWDALLELQREGLARSVGVSNFGAQHLEGIRASGRPLPVVNQIELHPYRPQPDVVAYCRQHGIAVMGFSPMVQTHKLRDPVVTSLAAKHGKTAAQVLIRWSVQQGYVTIPKSFSERHLLENRDVFTWSLTEEDLEALKSVEPHAILSNVPPTKTWEELL